MLPGDKSPASAHRDSALAAFLSNGTWRRLQSMSPYSCHARAWRHKALRARLIARPLSVDKSSDKWSLRLTIIFSSATFASKHSEAPAMKHEPQRSGCVTLLSGLRTRSGTAGIGPSTRMMSLGPPCGNTAAVGRRAPPGPKPSSLTGLGASSDYSSLGSPGSGAPWYTGSLISRNRQRSFQEGVRRLEESVPARRSIGAPQITKSSVQGAVVTKGRSPRARTVQVGRSLGA